MPEHGTRRQYRQGCHCLPCRAANARYEQERARDKAKGIPRLGTLISAKEARKRIQQLTVEHVPVASRLGLKHHLVRLHPSGQMTYGKWQRIRQLYDALMAEGPDEPILQKP